MAVSTARPASSTQRDQPADSPERANKRARFDAQNAKYKDGTTPGVGGGTGTGSSIAPVSAHEGVRWLKARIGDMERVFKEAVVAAALIMQHRVYCHKLDLPQRIPQHMTRRLERAWARYEALRRHVEQYLLQCAQAAATPSKPLTSLPTPGTLPGLGLTPLPTTPHGAGTSGSGGGANLAASLLGFDPAKFNAQGLEALHGFTPNSTAASGIAGAGIGTDGMEGGMDLRNLGMDELSALINGDGFDFASLAGDASGLLGMGSAAGSAEALLGQTQTAAGAATNGVGAGLTPNTQAETERLMASFNDITMPGPSSGAGTAIGGGSGDVDDPLKMSAEAIESLLASLPGGMGDGANRGGSGGAGDAANTGGMDFAALAELAGGGGGELGELDLSEFEGLFESNPGTAGGTPGLVMGQTQSQAPVQSLSQSQVPSGAGLSGAQGTSGAQPAAGVQNQQGQSGASQSQQGSNAGGVTGNIPQTAPQSSQSQGPILSPSQPAHFTSLAAATYGSDSSRRPAGGVRRQSSTQSSQPSGMQMPQPAQPSLPSQSASTQPQGVIGAIAGSDSSAGNALSLAQFSLGQNGTQVQSQVQSQTQTQPQPQASLGDMAGFGSAAGSASGSGTNSAAGFGGGTAGLAGFDMSVFDGELGGVNYDDFDFGDGTMPGVDGDEFESMFAEFK